MTTALHTFPFGTGVALQPTMLGSLDSRPRTDDLVIDEARYCPLCDERLALRRCPLHGVATITRRCPVRTEVVPRIGDVLDGRFTLEAPIGEGGMGRLFLATSVASGERFVVKVLRPELARDTTQLSRFYYEGTLPASIENDAVVRIYEVAVDDAIELPFIVMEHVDGETLEDLIAREGPLGEQRAARLFAQVAHGLAAAHAEGVLHRDLKPSNVMVRRTPNGEQACIVDFGLAKPNDPAQQGLTSPGMFLGTPSFMSPEQITDVVHTEKVDLYALGCVLHWALTGRAPFEGKDHVEVMVKQVRRAHPPLPHELADGRKPSDALRRLYGALLAKAPDDRPECASDVAKTFEWLTYASIEAETVKAGSFEELAALSFDDADTRRLEPEDVETVPVPPAFTPPPVLTPRPYLVVHPRPQVPFVARMLMSVAVLVVAAVATLTAIQVVPTLLDEPAPAPPPPVAVPR